MLNDLDRKEYNDIHIFNMADNLNGGIPVFLRRYSKLSDYAAPHRHDSIQINYISKGKLFHEINSSHYELVKGDIFVIPPYIPHCMVAIEGVPLEIVELEFLPEFVIQDGSLIDDLHDNSSFMDFWYIEPFLVTECNVKPRLNLSGEQRDIIEGLLKEFQDEYTARTDSYLLALRAILLKLLVQLGRYFRQSTEESNTTYIYDQHREAVEKAVVYLKQNYTRSISVNGIARIAMLSTSYFSYLFKAVTGKTLIEYLNDLRIQSAMAMLKETSSKVIDISVETGFNSVAHFNRTFKVVVGLTPTQYRKLSRSGR